MNHASRKNPHMQLGLIVIAMRQHGPHIAKILARQALAEAQHLHERTGVVGFDIAGPERGSPPRLFRSAYEIARLGRLGLTAHAGEDAPVDYVWQAVDELGVDRVGHACAAARDPELLRRLARDGIAVEVCLSSNYHTGAVKKGETHPLRTFLEAGVPVSLCCDNSTVSRTSSVNESLVAAGQVGLEAVERIHREAAGHTFIKPETALAQHLDG
jgi:adenosine deaminase